MQREWRAQVVCVCIQAKVVFSMSGWLWWQLQWKPCWGGSCFLFLMDRWCVTGGGGGGVSRHVWLQGWCRLVPRHGVTQVPPRGGRLTVNHLFGVLWGREEEEEEAAAGGEQDCDGWCWDACSYWPEKLERIVSYQEKCPVKNVSICAINTAAKGYLRILGFITGYVPIDSPAPMQTGSVEVGFLLTSHTVNHLRYRHKKRDSRVLPSLRPAAGGGFTEAPRETLNLAS